MDQSLTHVVHAHHGGFVLVAALVCLMGSGLTVSLLVRAKVLRGKHRGSHLGLGALIAGTTIWSTHFIAMLGYNPAGDLAYEPFLTGVTLVVAVIGCGLTVTLAGQRKARWPVVTGGVGFGLTVSVMHYIGMHALQVPGYFAWRYDMVGLSVIWGGAFGMVMVHRILKPLTRYCWLGGTSAMVLAVCGMHFTGMAATIYVPDTTVTVPQQLISNFTLGFIVLIVVSLILLIGFATFILETELSADSQRRLSDAARNDRLTGLPNRFAFQEFVEKLQSRLDDHGVQGVAVLALDLDGFKAVNDTFGHAAGDRMLCHVAHQGKHCLGRHEFFARIGGDEFIAIKSGNPSWQDADDFAHRLIAAIETPIQFGARKMRPAVSIGVATCPEDGTQIDALLNCADLAMYRAKGSKTEKIHFYDNEIERAEREKQSLLADLEEAVKTGALTLNYQLQNSLQTQDVIGFEVLARWHHPQRGRVGPEQFIPLAEESGLIGGLGLWVLHTACEEAARWDHPFPIAVNVSPLQLSDPAFAGQVANILEMTGLPAARLEIEITEATIIEDQESALSMMHQLKSMGIRIAMDDFGTGYSSLATLRVFPFDKIKIDRSFVQDVHLSKQNAAIVRATLLLGVALDVPVLAEGAETEDEIAFLTAERCAAVQGYHYGKPLDLEAVRLQTMRPGVDKKAV